MAFALAVVRYCRTLPHDIEADVFRKQFLKAGTSVGANYRASCRGRSPAERRAKLGIVLEESDECEYWLVILDTFDLGEPSQRKWLGSEAAELTRIFATSVRTMKGNTKRTKCR
jgi:four helix bundle protein